VLVYYSGWGYWESDIDDDNALTKVIRECPMFECGLFGLEYDSTAELGIKYKKKTTTKYLLESKINHPHIVKPITRYNYRGLARFILCEEWIENEDYLIDNPAKEKIVTFKRDEIFNDLSDLSKGILEQKMLDPLEVQATTKSVSRRIPQIELLLSTIDELEHDRLKIPVGEKQAVLNKCLKSEKIFTSKSVFDKVWSELSKNGQISIEGKENFLSIQ
jgi:hypothetical protein